MVNGINKKHTRYIPFLIILILPYFIVSFWFKKNEMFTYSEERLSLYDAQRTARQYSSVWFPVGTGYIATNNLARYPTFKALSFLQNAGVTTGSQQRILVYLLITSGCIWFFVLAKEFNRNNAFSFIASLFYAFNPFTLSQVWRRFLYFGMFAWSYLPLFLLLSILWFREKKNVYLLMLVISSFFYSHAFVHPGYIITTWSVVIIYHGVSIVEKIYYKKKVGGDILRLIVWFSVWIMSSLWWFYPMISLAGSSLTAETISDWKGNYEVTDALSKSFSNWQILLLRQKWWFGPEWDWYKYYSNGIVYMINVLLPVIMVCGLLSKNGIKSKKQLISILLVAFFIVKGTNFPFGKGFYSFIYKYFGFLASIRNPYEKMGILWLLPFSMFFSMGLFKISSYFSKKYKKVVAISTSLLIILVLCYPALKSDFLSYGAYEIPKFYEEADSYLDELQVNDTRIYSIPNVLAIEKIKYKWGYSTEDPSDNIFSFEILSTPGVPIYDSSNKILGNYWNDKNFPALIGNYGASVVLIRDDYKYPPNPFETVAIEDIWIGIESKKIIGPISVYKIKDSYVKKRIYASDKLLPAADLDEIISKLKDPMHLDEIYSEKDFYVQEEVEYCYPERLSFKRLSQVDFEVYVDNAECDFFIVLNNTYNPNWTMYLDNKKNEKHFLINGFANAWRISKRGDFKLTIKFKVWPWN